jgi:hypothetical protein
VPAGRDSRREARRRALPRRCGLDRRSRHRALRALALAAAELEAAARALPGLVPPLHRGAATQAALGSEGRHGRNATERGGRRGAPRGRPVIVVLEEPNQDQDDDDQRQQAAADVHISSPLSVVRDTTAAPGFGLRRDATIGARGDVAEWLGRGLQSLVQRFESARRLGRNECPRSSFTRVQA